MEEKKLNVHPKEGLIKEASNPLNRRYNLGLSIKMANKATDIYQLNDVFKRADMPNFLGDISELRDSFINDVRNKIFEFDMEIDTLIEKYGK